MLVRLLAPLAALAAAAVAATANARDDYEERRQTFVRSVGESTPGGLYSQAVRLAAGKPVEEAPIREALRFVQQRRDTSDFKVAGLIRIFHLGRPPLISHELSRAIRETLLGFKYWPDEPGDDDIMAPWTENHIVLFASAAYLAGQMFPEDSFTNNGEKGRWHEARGREKVLRWIDAKARAGMSEWDSNNYYPEDIAALLNVADFGEPKVAQRAAMMLDLLFFDMAVDSFRGVYGSAHGRAYAPAVLNPASEATAPLQRLAWGATAPAASDNIGATFLATSARYRVSELIVRIARDLPEEMLNRERQGLDRESGRQLGLKLEDPFDFFLLFDAVRFPTPRIAAQQIAFLDSLHLKRFQVVVRPYAESVVAAHRELEAIGITPTVPLDRTTISQTDKITFRTPDYQLSAAQDYRKGATGFQHHVWQATLGPGQVVFTLNPSVSSKYWIGRMPKVVQHRNVLFAFYHIPERAPPGPKTVFPPEAAGNAVPSPSPAEEQPVGHTVAVLRRATYDEVRYKNGWVFARKHGGYLALRSQLPARWTPDGALGGDGLLAEGRQNIWVCQLGREKVDGPFAAWTEKIATAPLEFGELSVRFAAPGVEELRASWDGPLFVDGAETPIHGYPRFDNPYCRAAWGEGRYEIEFGGERIVLDFSAVARGGAALVSEGERQSHDACQSLGARDGQKVDP